MYEIQINLILILLIHKCDRICKKGSSTHIHFTDWQFITSHWKWPLPWNLNSSECQHRLIDVENFWFVHALKLKLLSSKLVELGCVWKTPFHKSGHKYSSRSFIISTMLLVIGSMYLHAWMIKWIQYFFTDRHFITITGSVTSVTLFNDWKKKQCCNFIKLQVS